MTPKNKLLAIFLLFAQVTVLAQDTLKIRENDLETKRIKEGTKQYLVYIESLTYLSGNGPFLFQNLMIKK